MTTPVTMELSTVLSMGASSPLGPGAAWLLVVAVVGALVWSLVRERRGARIAWVRWIGVGVLLLILVVAPTREGQTPERGARPSVVLMVDTSESMGIGDAALGPDACTRWDAIKGTWLDPDTIARLGEVADVRLVGMDSRTRARTLPDLLTERPTGQQTRLVRGVRTVLAALGDHGVGGQAGSTQIVLLTDGVDTDGALLAGLADEAVSVGAKVSGVVPGSERGAPDVSLVLTSSADIVYAGQSTDLVVRVRQTGFDGRLARVVVREGGTSGRVVYDRAVTLDRATDLWVPVTPQREAERAGGVSLVEYVASVEPLEGESDATNNERRAFVRVTNERIRVCVFEGRPYWDTKFFVQALRDDPQIELTVVHALGSERVHGERVARSHVVRYVPDATGSYEERLAEPPLEENELDEFDVIVLGKGIDLFFPSMEAEKLVRFVTERGGSLVFLRGAPIDAEDPGAERAAAILAGISPVAWGEGLIPGGPLELTDEGKRQRALQFEHMRSTEEALEDLPDVLATSVVEKEKTLSVVWLRQGERAGAIGSAGQAEPAAIAQMSIGRGRTLAVLSDGMWRWAFLPASLGEHASVYQAFWSRAVRWLALGGDFLPGQSVSLDVDRLTTRPGDGVTAIVRTRFVEREDFHPTLTLHAPGGERRPVELGTSPSSPSKMTGIVVPDEEGVYELELRINPEADITPDVLTTRFAVYDDRVELLDTAARPEDVRALCAATGGTMLGLDGAGALIRQLEDERAAALTTPDRVPAWDSGWVFGVIVGLLGLEWIVRRRMGLA